LCNCGLGKSGSYKPIHIVFRRDDRHFCIGIGFLKRVGEFSFGGWIPLELERPQQAVFLFEPVNLLLLCGAPEIIGRAFARVQVRLDAFGNDEVLLERTRIDPQRYGVEILDDGVTNAVVVKEYLLTLFEFVAQVSAERADLKNHERLFE